LGGGPPCFPQGSTGPAVLGYTIGGWGDILATGLSPSLETFSNAFAYLSPITSGLLPHSPIVPHDPAWPTLAGFQPCGLGSSRFARRY